MTLMTSSGIGMEASRVAIASTTGDLEPYRVAASDVARELGFAADLAEHPAADDDSVREQARRVADADLLLAIVGWRRGELPDPEQGGDGKRSWAGWEVRAALRRARPVVVLMTGDGWPMEGREDDPAARAWLLDFRGDLYSLATFFDPESDPTALPDFRELVRRELARHFTGGRHFKSASGAAGFESVDRVGGEPAEDLRLRSWPLPELPATPYPVLLPYTHPDLLAGRQRECIELRRLLSLPVPILGYYGASGTGKSSLLLGGLVPALRAAGQPVAVVRHPAEPGLAGRLIGDLFDPNGDGDADPGEIESGDFVERLRVARDLAGAPPVLVIDQFEDLLNRRTGPFDPRRARAVAGVLLAASVQRQPGSDGALCRWLLAYRQESHGEVVRWLGDVLREARSLGLAGAGSLPHDLSGPERLHVGSLQPLGVPSASSADPVDEASQVFRAVIEQPLALRDDEGAVRYPWRFASGGVGRLARAFGETRVAQPQAPLLPELQVVLAHLLDSAAPSVDGRPAIVEVPEEPGELIAQALEEHLRRALDSAFPIDRRARRNDTARLGRTRALLALRELADAHGRRGEGLAATELARAIGHEGREVLEKLATPQTRLVVAQRHGDEWIYVLPHDRMADVLVRLVDEEGGRAGLGVDPQLLGLRRFVALKSELFATGEVEPATEVPSSNFRRIEGHSEALLWGEERQRWWQACQIRFRTERRRKTQLWGVAALVVLVVTVGVWSWADRQERRQALFEDVARGEPEAAFAAVNRLLVEWGAEPEGLRQTLLERERPFDVLERGIGGVAAGEGREEAVLRVAELALPLIVDGAPDSQKSEGRHDPVWIASLVWALDFFGPAGEVSRALRDQALEPLWRQYPPPPLPAAGDSGWADIPAGTFWMGSGPGEGRDDPDMVDERPKHKVTLSAFRIGTHEVTNAEFRRLYPEHGNGRADRQPAVRMNWHKAYTYAAWLSGRLPTEAEAEYVMRAECDTSYCRHDGSAASLDEVAWWLGNAMDPESEDMAPHEVGQLESNPWGLLDVYGNVWEICADWYAPYPVEHQVDPRGPTNSDTDSRSVRGGSVDQPADWVAAISRGNLAIGTTGSYVGLRVVLPEPVSKKEGIQDT